MRSRQYIIGKFSSKQITKGTQNGGIPGKHTFTSIFILRSFIALFFIFSAFSAIAFPQKIAIVVPESSSISGQILKDIESGFSEEFDLVEPSMSKMIFMEKRFERPFNLSIEDSKNYGSGVGCNYFLLVKTDTLRRTSFEREKYFESYAAYFLVSSRTGKLILWTLSKFEEDSPGRSQQKLTASIENSVHELSEKIRSSEKENIIYGRESDDFKLENNFTGSEDFRPPMPYRRVKPQYTRTASLYDILATVDAAVDIDDAGNVKNIEILRWAGFGLDESVVKTILGLKWRPADLKGKPLAMRILLRYNFKNIETDSETDTK